MSSYIHVWWKRYDGRDKKTNSKTNSSTKHILNTYGGVMQNKIYLCIYIMINIYFRVCVTIFNRWKETYGCKSISSCKPCKLQSEPPDQHPIGGAEGVECGIWKSVITQSKGGRLIIKLSNPHMSLGCWSGGPDWSLHGLLGLHLICSLDEKGVR